MQNFDDAFFPLKEFLHQIKWRVRTFSPQDGIRYRWSQHANVRTKSNITLSPSPARSLPVFPARPRLQNARSEFHRVGIWKRRKMRKRKITSVTKHYILSRVSGKETLQPDMRARKRTKKKKNQQDRPFGQAAAWPRKSAFIIENGS